jgi:hypothetical protein
MQQAVPRVIQSPYSGEYIRPRVVTREDSDHTYEEAVYTCPSSGNFVKKVVLSTEPKKKVVNENLAAAGKAAMTGINFLNKLAFPLTLARSASAMFKSSDGEPCDPSTGDPECVEVEENEDLLDDDKVLDQDEGESFVSVLKGIRNKIKDISSGKLLISRNNLLDALEEIDNDVEQILSSVEYNSGEKEGVAEHE